MSDDVRLDIEELSAVLHRIYQHEARRQQRVGMDTVRHPDDYDALPEQTKEYDRVLARYIVQREAELVAINERLYEERNRYRAALERIADPQNEANYRSITSGRFSVEPLTRIARDALGSAT